MVSSLSIVRDPWVPARGLNAPKEAIDALFTEWDKDGGGALEYKELSRILKSQLRGNGRQGTIAPPAISPTEKGGAKLKKAGMAAVAVKGAKGGK